MEKDKKTILPTVTGLELFGLDANENNTTDQFDSSPNIKEESLELKIKKKDITLIEGNDF